MGKRPHLEYLALSLRVPRGHEGFWSIIQEIDPQGPWKLADIYDRSNVSDRSTIRDFLTRLVRGGFAVVVEHVRIGRPPVPVPLYRLVRPSREAPRIRRDGTVLPEPAQETLWRSMKMLGRFTVDALAAAASTEDRIVPRATAHRYVRLLAEVGVLSVAFAGTRGSPAEYLLVRNLGGFAPKILRAHVVFDPNSNTVLGASAAKEVA